jgi:hypothetical protein
VIAQQLVRLLEVAQLLAVHLLGEVHGQLHPRQRVHRNNNNNSHSQQRLQNPRKHRNDNSSQPLLAEPRPFKRQLTLRAAMEETPTASLSQDLHRHRLQ